MSKFTPGVSFDFRGHAVLVTGATKGIGAAIAEACAEAGANVVIHGRNAADAQGVLEKCRAHGVRATFVPADFLGEVRDVVPAFFQKALAAEPGLDMLVTNAGGCIHYGPLEDMTFDQYQQLMRLNVESIYFLVQQFTRHWIAKKTRGRVVIVGSINGRLAEAYSSLYDCAKGAIEMMVRSFAVEFARQGVRVNGMAPGLIRTPFTRWVDERPNDGAWIALHTPNQKIPGPEACVGISLLLLSDAADHIHGQMMLVDGGMSAWQQPNRPPSLAIPWSIMTGPQGSLKEI